uniref:PPUP9514 n=1 Tax=Poeciliopsis prolifica TaxID=188132 RepID=A0A0S7ES85_9TELE
MTTKQSPSWISLSLLCSLPCYHQLVFPEVCILPHSEHMGNKQSSSRQKEHQLQNQARPSNVRVNTLALISSLFQCISELCHRYNMGVKDSLHWVNTPVTCQPFAGCP